MFRRAVVALIALLATGIALRAQDTPRIWQGVYTTAQAERGKAVFNTTCLRCHGEDLAGKERVGLSIAVANAHPWVRERAHWRTRLAGGAGAAREVADLILAAQGKSEAELAAFVR